MSVYSTLTAAIALLASTDAAASDEAANAVYERLQASCTAADPGTLLEKVYAPGATYLAGHKDVGIDTREGVLRIMIGSQQHLRKSGGLVDLKFRVIDRKRLGGAYVDSGYMRVSVKPGAEAAEQVSYAKFVTVVAPQPGGYWAFVTDAESETPPASFAQARPVEGLKFDN